MNNLLIIYIKLIWDGQTWLFVELFFKKSKKNEYYQTVSMTCMNSCIPCYWTIHSINVICGLFSSNANLFTVNFVCVCVCFAPQGHRRWTAISNLANISHICYLSYQTELYCWRARACLSPESTSMECDRFAVGMVVIFKYSNSH